MKILFTIVLTILMTSCALVLDTVEIGMDESEFKEKNRGIYLAEMTADFTIYRLPQSETRDLIVYFEKGKLVRVHETIYRPDVIIERRQIIEKQQP